MTLILNLVQADISLTPIVEHALSQFAAEKIKKDDFAITFIAIDRKSEQHKIASYNGDMAMYPASVVKLFYMAYAHQLFAEERLKPSAELDRALNDMIRDSNNDATGLVLDTITATTGGPELGKAALKTWMEKRQAVNNWLRTQGFTGINCCQKTWNEGPYGREKQGYGPNMELRNSLTSDACATMLLKIMTDAITTPTMCAAMRALLKRDPKSQTDTQAQNFLGPLLVPGDQLYSKAGWTSTVRHDVAYIKRGDQEIILSIFTKHRPEDPKFLKFLAKELLALPNAAGG